LQYRERIIFIGQYIDEEFGNQVLATMLYLDSIDNTKPLYLYLNSPGGDVRFQNFAYLAT
jgi:ATP-dependent Clp protease protease subunit